MSKPVHEGNLRLIVQTPREVVVDLATRSVRLPTESGQVGLRRGHEALVLAIEPGLILARTDGELRFVGTIGGLLESDGATARLLTPWGVAGGAAAEVWSALEQALSAPDAEVVARLKLAQLEAGILSQLRRNDKAAVPSRGI